jgi:hypothetical protein
MPSRWYVDWFIIILVSCTAEVEKATLITKKEV